MVNAYRIILALLASVASAVAAAAPHDREVAEGSVSADSDGLRERTADAGYIKALPSISEQAMAAVRAGYWLLDSPNDRIEFGTLRLDHASRLGPVDVTLQGQQLGSSDWSPTLGSASLAYHAMPRLTLDAGAEAGIVDTVIAARRHTLVNSANGFLEYQPLDSVTLVGGVVQQWFSDGNHRFGRIAKLVYAPSWLEGFNVQLRARRIDSQFSGIGYFSPPKLEEAIGLLQYGHALPGGRFVLTGVAGGGEQRVDGGSATSLYQGELRLRGWFSDQIGIEAKAGCTNTGGLEVQAATGGYRYCYSSLSLIRSL